MSFDPTVFKANQKAAWESVADAWHNGIARSLALVAEDVAHDAHIPTGSHVLDLATGDGVVAFAAYKRGAGSVIASDLASTFAPIIEEHAEKIDAVGNITFATVDMEDIPYAEHIFDAVTCQFGLMFVPHRAKAFSEIHRVLKHEGSFTAAVWSAMEKNEHFAEYFMMLSSFMPKPPEGTPTMFGCGIPGLMKAEVEAAGFVNYTEKEKEMVFRSTDLDEAWESWSNVGPFRYALANMPEEKQADVEAAVRQYLKAHQTPSGTVEVPAKYILFRAVKP